MATSCFWAQGQFVSLPDGPEKSPFEYKASNGTVVPPQGGPKLPGGPNCCVYPGAILAERNVYGAGLPDPIGPYAFLIVVVAFFVYTRIRCPTCRKRFEAKGRNYGEEIATMKDQKRRRNADATNAPGTVDANAAPSFYAKHRGMFLTIMMSLMIYFQIQIGIQINEQTQLRLPVTARNGQVVAESILNPMDDIFSFLDDILLVKIGAALVANDFIQMRKVFLLGTFGGAAMGVIGAVCATILMSVPSLAQAILNPFGGEGTCQLAENEDIGPSSIYFIASAWAWPFSFANFALSGFAMGLGNFEALIIINVISTGLYFAGIVVVFAQDPRLEVLGYVRFASSAIATVLWVGFFAGSKSLRVKLGLTSPADQESALLPGGQHATRRAAVHDFWSDPETKLAMRDGLLAMLVEFSVEVARTVTLYVAAKTLGIGAFYQISAHMAIQMSTGLSLAQGALIVMKLNGPQLLGAGLHDQFLWLIEYVFVFALIAAVACALTVYTSVLSLMVDNGNQISIFAGGYDDTCLQDYGGFFGNSASSLFANPSFETTVLSVPVVVFIRVVYQAAKSALYAMQDFLFMVQVSLASFVLVFLPAVVVMGFTSQSALVAVAVMTLPNLLAAIAFNVRLKVHTDRLDSEDGSRHNAVYQRQQSALREAGADVDGPEEGQVPRGNSQSSETELPASWGSASRADRVTGGGSRGVMPPPS